MTVIGEPNASYTTIAQHSTARSRHSLTQTTLKKRSFTVWVGTTWDTFLCMPQADEPRPSGWSYCRKTQRATQSCEQETDTKRTLRPIPANERSIWPSTGKPPNTKHTHTAKHQTSTHIQCTCTPLPPFLHTLYGKNLCTGYQQNAYIKERNQ